MSNYPQHYFDAVHDTWTPKYEKMRSKLLVRDSNDSDEVYARKLEIANTMECANRVIEHFLNTRGEVTWKVI